MGANSPVVMQNMSSRKSALDLDANVVAGLCYVGNFVCFLGLVLSIITIVTDKTNKLARFHAMQSILLSVLWFVIAILHTILTMIGSILDRAMGVPVFGLLCILLMVVLWLLFLGSVIFTAVKAFQGQIFKFPVIGNFADQYSN